MAEVLRRASIDAEFRSLALKDATAALGAVGAPDALGGTEYRFIESGSAHHVEGRGVNVFVLPEFVSNPSELSKEELDQVAGGCDVVTCCMTM